MLEEVQCGTGEQQRVSEDRFMNTLFNLACVLRTVNHRAGASQRGFTIINQVIYKQANKNK